MNITSSCFGFIKIPLSGSGIPQELICIFVLSVNKICSNLFPLILGKITCLSLPWSKVKMSEVSISAFDLIGRKR